MIFKEKQNRILSVTVKVLNNYDNYKLKDIDSFVRIISELNEEK